MTEMAALETRDLSIRFGGVVALDQVSIKVPMRGLTGLIGPNGAGKSTLIDAVTGFLRDRGTGEVLLGGHSISSEPPHRRTHLGLGRTWQSQELFEDISVEENVRISARRLTLGSAVASMFRRREQDRRVDETLEMLELGPVATRSAGSLTQRDRKLVGIARAIVSRPRLALLDEPAAGLDRQETAWLAAKLNQIVTEGIPILLVDHDMNLVLEHSDRVIVIDRGRVLAEGSPAAIRKDAAVIEAYLGGISEQQP